MKSKILIFSLILSIIISSFVFPVSADTMTESIFTQNVDSQSTSRFRYRVGVNNLTALNNLSYSTMTQANSVALPGPEAIEYGFTVANTAPLGAVLYIADGSLVRTDGTHNYTTGDTCFVKSGYIAVSSDTLNIVGYRLTLRRYVPTAVGDTEVRFGPVLATTTQVNQKITGTIAHDQLPLTFLQDVAVEDLVLCLELVIQNPSPVGGELVVFLQNQFAISYGAGKDPNYPIYGGASGKDEFNDFGNAEQEVLDSQQVGINAGTGAMSSAGAGLNSLNQDVNLLAGTALISGYLTRITGAVGLWPIVEISIALGLFASLLGLAGSIVTAKDSKSYSGSKSSRNSKSNKKGG